MLDYSSSPTALSARRPLTWPRVILAAEALVMDLSVLYLLSCADARAHELDRAPGYMLGRTVAVAPSWRSAGRTARRNALLDVSAPG